MKTVFKMTLVVILTTLCCTFATAQERSKERLTRQELAAVQAQAIAKKLSMSPEDGKVFSALYLQYQEEIWALGPRVRSTKAPGTSAKSEEETQQELEDRFDRSQKILEIRKKYYGEYSKFLSQNEIKQLYKLEREIMERLSKSRSSRRK